jgi:DNA-binding response OmpR family regulator
MIAYIEDDTTDFRFFTRHLKNVKQFAYLRDFQASTESFDLVIADLGLPDAMLAEVTDKLKPLDVPVILFTGLGEPHSREMKKIMAEEKFKHIVVKGHDAMVLPRYIEKHFPGRSFT